METRLVHLPFVAGLEQKKDVVALDPPELPTILNYQFSKDGALDTRSGFVSQSTTLIAGGQIEVPAAMAEANGELLAVSSVTQANLYGATDPLAGWVQKGTAVEWLATKYWAANRVFAETTPITQVFDLEVVSGLVWCVSAYGAEVTLCAYDADSLALKWSGTTFSGLSADAVTAVRLCAFNGSLFVGLQQDAINLLSVYKVTPSTFAVSAWHTYANNQRWMDIKAASDRMIVAHWNGAAVELLQYDTSFTLVGTKTIASLNGADNLIVAVGAVGEYVYAIWYDSTAGRLYVWGDILLSSAAAAFITAFPAVDAIAAIKVASDKVYALFATSTVGAVSSAGTTFQGATPVPTLVGYSNVYDVIPAANLFTENSVNYCPMFPTVARSGWTDNGQIDSAYVLHDITHYSVNAVPRICGTLSPRDAARQREQVLSSGKCMLPNVPQIQTGVRVAAVQQVDGSIALFVLDSRNVASNPRFQRTQVADTVLFNGAMPTEYDGVQPYEYGFVRAPSIKATAVGAGSGSMTGGIYNYAATYVWRDGHGNIVQSPVGGLGNGIVRVNANVVATGSAVISWNPLSPGVTRKYRDQGSLWNPEIWIYRNEPGSVAYYLAHVVEMTASMSTGTVQTWTDTAANGAYTTNGLLYTSGDVLEDELPPAFTVVVAHRNRLFGADKTNLWYTKSYVANSLPGFNDIFILPIDEGGDITALASMDSSLIVFKRDRIFAVAGDGPTDNGSNNDLNVQRVAAQNGCIAPRSVVVTTWGVFFQAEDGVYMLGRDMSLSYIGAPAEISLSASPIVAAHYLSGTAQVAFVLSTNITCVYDMTFQRWTIFRPFQTCTSASATAYEGELVMGGADTGVAVVLRLTDGATGDDAAGIRGVFQTAWVKTGGIQGFQRVRRIMLYGTVVADASVDVKLEFDYASTNSQTETWTATQIGALKADGRIQLEVQPQYQKCESFRVTVTENAGSGTGRGITWESVMLECGLKASRFKGLADGARK